MRTIIKGKHIHKTYEIQQNVEENENGQTYYINKPELVLKDAYFKWEDICGFEGDYQVNSKGGFSFSQSINISANESVTISKTIFRADLNEQHVFTNKVLSENDNKGKLQSDWELVQRMWSSWVIASVPRLTEYCKLHHLEYADTDAETLIDVVYGDGYKLEYKNETVEVVNSNIYLSSSKLTVDTSLSPLCTIKNNSIITTSNISNR